MSLKSLSVRMEEEILDKIHVISSYEDRSANGQVLMLIKRCIKEYEKSNPELFENLK